MQVCSIVYNNLLLFCFKQKTAYEMRISDWSSDVCSSDLSRQCASFITRGVMSTTTEPAKRCAAGPVSTCQRTEAPRDQPTPIASWRSSDWARPETSAASCSIVGASPTARDRSEEHTSELQSLMRISYAVFCLKKKQNTQRQLTSITITE